MGKKFDMKCLRVRTTTEEHYFLFSKSTETETAGYRDSEIYLAVNPVIIQYVDYYCVQRSTIFLPINNNLVSLLRNMAFLPSGDLNYIDIA